MEDSRVEYFVERLLPAVERAAGFARGLEGRVRNAPKLEESSPEKQALTMADTGTQEVILRALLEAFPDVSLEAEEATETVTAFPEDSNATVVIDPIDGTLRSYLEARGPYAVIVGLAVNEVYQAGLVALPREGLVFDATRGQGAWGMVSGRSRRPVRAVDDGRRVLLANGLPEAVAESLRARDYEVIRACGGAVSVAPLIRGVCAGLRHSNASAGISVRGRVGTLIAREGGAIVCCPGGVAFPEDMETPAKNLLLATDASHLEALEEALTAIPA
ncbi:MAG: hypothetical protein GY733_13980 [bacterium]|nr:hypothetical protein [bacterium]